MVDFRTSVSWSEVVAFMIVSAERWKNLRLPDVTCNKTEFDPTIAYGKKPTLFNLNDRAQHLVAWLPFPETEILKFRSNPEN
jgi:hypothetical protein